MGSRGRLPRVALAAVLPLVVLCLAAPTHAADDAAAKEAGRAPVYGVAEITFRGPPQRPADSPARDVTLSVLFRHDGGKGQHRVQGFWDGDGRGGAEGDVFKVRFCPTAPGRWTLAEVASSSPQLKGQREGEYVTVAPSEHPGFWLIDEASPGRRWYRRSDGSHSYVLGNTHYSFLSGTREGGRPSGNDVAADVA